jgi:hypothetical protein
MMRSSVNESKRDGNGMKWGVKDEKLQIKCENREPFS